MSGHRSKQLHRLSDSRIQRLGNKVNDRRQASLILQATKDEYNAVPKSERGKWMQQHPEAFAEKKAPCRNGTHRVLKRFSEIVKDSGKRVACPV